MCKGKIRSYIPSLFLITSIPAWLSRTQFPPGLKFGILCYEIHEQGIIEHEW